MEHSVYIARQPIYDTNGNIFAYELFYRENIQNSVEVEDNLHATARVLVNALNYVGLHTLTTGHTAFLKVDDKTIMDDLIYSIAPAHFVLEILEESVISSELVRRIEILHKKGYRFALNHYHIDRDFLRNFQALMEVVDYVKIDINEFENLSAVFADLEKYSFKKIAEKIEEPEHYNRAKAIGFDYLQGYYISKPDVIKKQRIEPQFNLLLDLIHLLQSHASMDKLIEKVNSSPYLLINLLNYIHMHEGFAHDTIASAEQALVVIGRDRFSNWLELMIYAHDEDAPSERFAKELSQRARHRACLMEEFARRIQATPSFQHAAYLTGLLSLSENIYGDSFAHMVKQTRIERNIADALTKKNGDLGQLLQLAIAIEKNNLHDINSILGQLQLSQRELNAVMLASYRRSAAPV